MARAKKLPPDGPDKATMDLILGIAYQLGMYLAPDALAAIAEEGSRRNPYITRDELLELVIDANRLEDELRKKLPESVRTDVLMWMKNVDFSQMCELLKPAFKYAKYS